MRIKSPLYTALVVLTLVVLTIMYVLPIYVVVVTSLKSPAELAARQYLLPSANLQFENYVQAFRLIFPSLLNSTIIAFSVTGLSALFGGLAGTISAAPARCSPASCSSSSASPSTCRTRPS